MMSSAIERIASAGRGGLRSPSKPLSTGDFYFGPAIQGGNFQTSLPDRLQTGPGKHSFSPSGSFPAGGIYFSPEWVTNPVPGGGNGAGRRICSVPVTRSFWPISQPDSPINFPIAAISRTGIYFSTENLHLDKSSVKPGGAGGVAPRSSTKGAAEVSRWRPLTVSGNERSLGRDSSSFRARPTPFPNTVPGRCAVAGNSATKQAAKGLAWPSNKPLMQNSLGLCDWPCPIGILPATLLARCPKKNREPISVGHQLSVRAKARRYQPGAARHGQSVKTRQPRSVRGCLNLSQP